MERELEREYLGEKTHSTACGFQKRWKWIFLILLAISQFELAYNLFSIPNLQLQLEADLGLTDPLYRHLMILQSIPGLAVPIIAGILTNYTGAGIVYGFGITLRFIGVVTITIGIFAKSLTLLFAGSIIQMGVVEFIYISRAKLISIWYERNEMGKVVAVINSAGTLGTLASQVAYTNLFEIENSLELPYKVASILAAACFLLGIYEILLTRSLTDIKPEQQPINKSPVHLVKSLKKLPLTYWLVSVVGALGYTSFLYTTLYENKFLQLSFAFTIGNAGIITAMVSLLCGVVTPVLGVMVDKVGRLPSLLVLSIFFSLIGIFSNVIIPSCERCLMPSIPLLLLTLSIGMMQLLVSNCLYRLLKEEDTAIGFGVTNAIGALSVMVYPVVIQVIVGDENLNTDMVFIFMMNSLVSVSALIITIVLWAKDYFGNKKLHAKGEPKTSEFNAVASIFNDSIWNTGRKSYTPMPMEREN